MKPLIFAGPCGVLPRREMKAEVEFLKSFDGPVEMVIRGGAYKGQLYPGKKMVHGEWVQTKREYTGLKNKGVNILLEIQREYGIDTCTEVQDLTQAGYARYLSWVQVGARHMGNLPLLRYLNRFRSGNILLKRGMGNTIHEWIGAAEHLTDSGKNTVTLCERGISTFENTDPRIRWRPDMLAIPQIRADYPKYEIILDVSHSCGRRDLVIPMAKAALACGADGIMVEVMKKPDRSMTDAQQTIDHDDFKRLMEAIV